MPSPFPGMDPYLEDPSVWEEFHHVFITECMYELSERLPDRYVAKIDERVQLISWSDEATRQYLPDVAVARARSGSERRPAAGSGGGAAVALAPVVIPSDEAVEVREAFIEIVRLPGYDLVTSVELLSPWNKFGDGVGVYRSKRRSLIGQGVHVVEIDLLTRGRRTELARPLPGGDYFVCVFRADKKPDVDVYAWGVRQPLPPVPVPLRAPDPDITLDLSVIVGTAYDRGRYARKLRYAQALAATLAPADAAWAADMAKRVSAS